jgi:hypothetical protein
VVQVNANGVLERDLFVHEDGMWDLRSGTLRVEGNVDGNINLNGGHLQHNKEARGSWKNSGTIGYEAATTPLMNALTIDNSGLVSLAANAMVQMENSSMILNAAGSELRFDDGASLIGTSGTIRNGGVIRKVGGSGLAVIGSGVAFSNTSGIVDVQTGILRNAGATSIYAGQTFTKRGAGEFDAAGGLGVEGDVTHEAGKVTAGGTWFSTGRYGDGGWANYTISGGELSATIFVLGNWETKGRVTQSGGKVNVWNLSMSSMEHGGSGAGRSEYNMSGGELAVGGYLTIGGLGQGTFTQSGGVINNGMRHWVGYGATGSHVISGGTINTVEQFVGYGAGASGTFSASGNAVVNAAAVSVGTNGGAGSYSVAGNAGVNVSAYVMNDGTWSQADSATAVIGDFGGTGETMVSGGSMTANHIRQHSLTVSGGSVNIRSSGGGYGPGESNRTSIVKNITISGSGRFDLTNQHLIVDWDSVNPVADVKAAITSAYSGGAWSGAGITSSKITPTNKRAVGYYDNAAPGTIRVFGGQAVDASATLVRYTLAGDTDLDGTIAFADLLAMQANYGLSGKMWQHGDVDYDGTITLRIRCGSMPTMVWCWRRRANRSWAGTVS